MSCIGGHLLSPSFQKTPENDFLVSPIEPTTMHDLMFYIVKSLTYLISYKKWTYFFHYFILVHVIKMEQGDEIHP